MERDGEGVDRRERSFDTEPYTDPTAKRSQELWVPLISLPPTDPCHYVTAILELPTRKQ